MIQNTYTQNLWKIKNDIFLKLYKDGNLSLEDMKKINIFITNYLSVVSNLLFINLNKDKKINGKR